MITSEGYQRLAQVAELLLPGDAAAPPAAAIPELEDLLRRAVKAVGGEADVVAEAISALPAPVTWESLEALDRDRPDLFEPLAAVAAGAYFMAPEALDAIGYPHGPRKPASREQIVDELETGILEPVLDRPSSLREVRS